VFPLNLYARVRSFYLNLHARPRVQRAPGLPCALCHQRAATRHNSGARRVAGSRSYIQLSSPALCAIAHWSGRSSIPEAAMMETIGRGVLDRPVKPGDDGWRVLHEFESRGGPARHSSIEFAEPPPRGRFAPTLPPLARARGGGMPLKSGAFHLSHFALSARKFTILGLAGTIAWSSSC
jgi:hypothetical protein